MTDWEDTKLIECDRCGAALNGKSLWIVGVGDAKTEELCEECYAKAQKLEDWGYEPPKDNQ